MKAISEEGWKLTSPGVSDALRVPGGRIVAPGRRTSHLRQGHRPWLRLSSLKQCGYQSEGTGLFSDPLGCSEPQR